MKILHGTWIPAAADFIQTGAFYLWVETTEATRKRSKTASVHPHQLAGTSLAEFLATELGIKSGATTTRQPPQLEILPQYFLLPTIAEQPLPSLELARYLETELPETFDWQYWQVDCYKTTALVKNGYQYASVNNVIKVLNELHFLTLHQLADVQLGADLLFWYHYTQAFKQVILRDRYIPALKYRSLATKKTSRAAKSTAKSTTKSATRTKKPTASTATQTADFELYSGWEILSEQYEAEIEQYAEVMPLVCTAGFAVPPETLALHDKATLLRHFSECLLTDLVTHSPSTTAFDKKVADSLLELCLSPQHSTMPNRAAETLEWYQQWKTWRDRIHRSQAEMPFHLCFQLKSPDQLEEPWILEFQVAAKHDPSQRIALLDYWQMRSPQQKQFHKDFGKDFEQVLLMNLGYAARIYPALWAGLDTDQPISISLTADEAATFLKETAWVLEEAGYKVIVPAWWTPKGWQRAKIRLKASGRKIGGNDKSKSYFSFDTLVDYQYELSIGGEAVSQQEWQQLVNAKSSLVQFRGQWMELDPDKMQQMLEFWKKHKQEHPEMGLLDFMKLTATGEDGFEFEVDHDQTLTEMLSRLNDKSALEVLPEPQPFNGTLREYQKRGVSWLHYLESLGLNGCLADDMGMGKSAQVIARLVQERQDGEKLPTLLIAPTSVVGNWQKEIEKFAPQLRSHIHHGSDREQDGKAFNAIVQNCDVLITSFSLVRRDEKLLGDIHWHRIVIDEAQNIKNPKAAQTKAILKLSAAHRLALTGTPVENRLLDLWSIFNFLNPGYLGKEAYFRKSFEIPIQKNNQVTRSTVLKKLVEPFILRRVKTDPAIIQDLPDKVEQKLFCNLTKEQASLYEATVKDVEKKLNEADGIQRKGLILATLLKLKQICNHPRQFLQDNSEFTPERSHKLERLTEMVTEAMEAGESMLVFTQFTDIGEALEKYLRHLHYKTYYLHGGTNRIKRETMIANFQDPETEPSVFILSLKAGGVGITLTKANHVFHFDRWWNPAVENQATDRAFRIGQKKNVFVHKFVAIGTLEERIDQMIEDKKKLAGAIVGSDESWLTELDNESFKKLIALNKKAVME